MVIYVNNGNYFETRERALHGDNYERLFNYAKTQPYRGITVNTRVISTDEFIKNAPFKVGKSKFAAESFYISADEKAGLNPWYHAGLYYVQEPSASSAACILAPNPGDKVLDLCAAPGGKSAQLAAYLKGEGLLFSNEYDRARSKILLSNTERMGADNVAVLNEEPARLAKALPEYFDKILVDAPCSGEGMFRKEPQAKTQHCEQLVKSCAELQAQILDCAAQMLKCGGEMVYSTCTFSLAENEENISAFLIRHPEFNLIDCDAPFGGKGIKRPEFNFNTDYLCRIYPCHGGEGHFVAKLRKGENGEEAANENGSAKQQKSGTVKKPAEYTEFIKKYFPSLSGREISVNEDNIYILPKTPMPRLKGLRILRVGVPAGKIEKKRFVPHHALFKAFGLQCENKISLSFSDKRLAEYLHGDEIQANEGSDGYIAVLVDGYSLGMGKKNGERIKNHYPKGLRNLK